MEERTFGGLKYLISYPKDFDKDKKYPLVIFLHGAGTRSETTDILMKNVCFINITARQDARGYIVLAPLCKSGEWNEWMTILLRLVESVRELPFIDKKRVHLTGNSMGGYGTWELAILRPDWFASAMPVCGGGCGGFTRVLVNLPIRAFHGLRDDVVDPIESFHMVRALNMAGGHAELILFPQLTHDCWTTVYSDERNYDWLLSFTTERDRTLAEKLSADYYG